jgi:hypothetical protein
MKEELRRSGASIVRQATVVGVVQGEPPQAILESSSRRLDAASARAPV